MIGVNGVLPHHTVAVKTAGTTNPRGFKLDLTKLGKLIKMKINHSTVHCFDKKNDNTNTSQDVTKILFLS